jgi:hypothetical protein
MDYFVPMTQLPMIVQLSVMKLQEKFYAQLMTHPLDVSQEPYAWPDPKILKVNIVLVTLSVLKNANGMRYNAPMGLIHEDARTKICVYKERKTNLETYALRHAPLNVQILNSSALVPSKAMAVEDIPCALKRNLM